MKRSRLVGVGIAALLVALLGAPGASAKPAARTAQLTATIKVNINPLTQDGRLKPGYEIAATFRHSWCWTGSDKVPGAFRCILGNAILDPCWPRIDAAGTYHGSYCLTVPWRHAGIVLRGRHIAPDHRTGRQLWGLHTTDGYGCVASPGANSRFHGQFLFWRCDYGARWLLFTIDKASAQWQATEVTDTNGHIHDAHRVGITKAWFGVSPFGLG